MSIVRNAGLAFYSIGVEPPELDAYMVRNPGLISSMTSLRAGNIQRKRVMISGLLYGCESSCVEPDLVMSEPFVADAIISNPLSFAHVHCAQALGIPVYVIHYTVDEHQALPHPWNTKLDPESAGSATVFVNTRLGSVVMRLATIPSPLSS